MKASSGLVGFFVMAACSHSSSSTTDAAASDDVQACLDGVEQEQTFYCQGTSRQCLYAALKPFCMSDRAAYIEEVFHCLTLDGAACPAPDDPSNGQECIDTEVAMVATDADKALGAAICACESPPETNCDQDLPENTLPTLLFMEEADIVTLTNCITTMGCAQLASCTNVSPLAAAFACTD